MYEVLCHLGELFFQGLLTSLFIFLLARWYDNKVTFKKAKVAALFVIPELEIHIAVLATIIKRQALPKPNDDDFCFCSQNWEEFKNNLVPLLKYEDLKRMVDYYKSIDLILSMARHSKAYHEYEAFVVNALDEAKYSCERLRDLADISDALSSDDTNAPHIP